MVANSDPLGPREAIRSVVKSLLAAKRLVLLAGAGISTSSGIPDFRSADGLYERGSGKRRARDLFSADVFRDPEATEEFHRFVASLQCLAKGAKPTATHRFVHTLAQKGRLVRMYTQNVDDLELRAKIKAATGGKEGHVVQLHGSVNRVKCACGYRGELQKHMMEAFAEGLAPACPACDNRADERARAGKRTLSHLNGCGQLRPDMVLYNEDYPADLATLIAELSAADLRGRVDFVLVMGTSLRIPGFKKLVKDFAKRAHDRGNDRPRVVLVNDTEVTSKEWNGIFDVHIRGRCDDFCNVVMREWRSCRPDDFMRQPALGDLTNFAIVKAVPDKKSSKRASASLESTPPSTATKRARLDRNPQSLPTPTTSPARQLSHRRTSSMTRI